MLCQRGRTAERHRNGGYGRKRGRSDNRAASDPAAAGSGYPGELTEVLAQASDDYVTVILTDQVDLDILDMQIGYAMHFPIFWKYRERRRERQITAMNRKNRTTRILSSFAALF